jgi:hypothetical protein
MKNYISIMAALGILIGGIGTHTTSRAKVFVQEQKKNYTEIITEINHSIENQMERYKNIYIKLDSEKEKYCENYDPKYTDYLDYGLETKLDTNDENYEMIKNSLLCEQYAKESEIILEIYLELKEKSLKYEEIREMSEKKLQERSKTLDYIIDEIKINLQEIKKTADEYELILKEE